MTVPQPNPAVTEETTPQDLRNQAVKKLQQTVTKMTSPEWELALLAHPEERERSNEDLGAAQQARVALENAQLEEIIQKLQANAKDLKKGITAMDQALADLKKVKVVLDCVEAFLKIVGRIVIWLP